MRRSVSLDALPDKLTFPSEMADRIRFDPQQQQLSFEGFMSKKDFDRLVRLSSDLNYQKALEALFQKCAFSGNTAPEGKRARWWLAGVSAGAAALLASAAMLLL